MNFSALLFLLLGLALLYCGGEGLVRGSSALALRLGLTPLVVGLTVVAFGTSAPEMVVSVQAALAGEGAIAIGNVIGSNTLNIGLILALTALITPLQVQLQILRLDAPIMVGVTLLGVGLLADGQVSRAEGGLLAALLVGYVVLTVRLARKETPSAEVQAEFAESVRPGRGSVGRDLLFTLGGLVLLVLGSRAMVHGAVAIARDFGVSEAVIGLTIVALGTSLPELTACAVAAIKREPDIVLGNIIGSNVFNILGILGTAALARPLAGDGIRPADLWVCVLASAVLLPILWSGRRLERWEGALMISGYGVYVARLWPD